MNARTQDAAEHNARAAGYARPLRCIVNQALEDATKLNCILLLHANIAVKLKRSCCRKVRRGVVMHEAALLLPTLLVCARASFAHKFASDCAACPSRLACSFTCSLALQGCLYAPVSISLARTVLRCPQDDCAQASSFVLVLFSAAIEQACMTGWVCPL